MQSQEDMILEYLKLGKSITPILALNMFGCFRLGARIFDLKQKGYRIEEMDVKDGRKRYARYFLAEHTTAASTRAETAQGGGFNPKIGIEAVEPHPQAQRQAFEKNGQMAFLG